jgi:hypothetical protein
MRWHNPLNTTQNGFGGQSQNSVGVKAYPTIDTGIQATIATLLNGRYPNIVTNLRAALPQQNWLNAIGDLGIWGTGANWLGLSGNLTDIRPPGSPPAGAPLITNPLDAIGKSIAHFGFLMAGLLLFALGLSLLVVPEFIKPAQAIAKAAASKTPEGKVAEVIAA